MKKILYLFSFILIVFICEAHNISDSLYKTDKAKFNKQIDSLRIQQQRIIDQENYFTQALSSQKLGFSDFIKMYSSFIAILFGFIGVGSFSYVLIGSKKIEKNLAKDAERIKTQLIEDADRIKEQLISSVQTQIDIVNVRYEDINAKQTEIRNELSFSTAQMYVIYIDSLEDYPEKFLYATSALKYYCKSSDYKTTYEFANELKEIFDSVKPKSIDENNFNDSFLNLSDVKNYLNDIQFEEKQNFEEIVNYITTNLATKKCKNEN